MELFTDKEQIIFNIYPSLTERVFYFIRYLFIYMNTEQIRSILNKVIKEKYPEIDMEIYISFEPDVEFHGWGTNKKIINVFFDLPWYEHDKYVMDGIDKEKLDNIRALIRDFVKMLGIFDRVKFYFSRHDD